MLRHRLGTDCTISIDHYGAHDSGNAESTGENTPLCVSLRVTRPGVELEIPYELVLDLAGCYLGRTEDLDPPSANEAVTAFGLLIAEMLADEPLFSAHRVCLNSIAFGELESKTTGGRGMVLSFALVLAARKYRVCALLDRELLRRLQGYSKFILPVTQRNGLLRSMAIPCRINLHSELPSLNLLTSSNLSIGTIIPLSALTLSASVVQSALEWHGAVLSESTPEIVAFQIT